MKIWKKKSFANHNSEKNKDRRIWDNYANGALEISVEFDGGYRTGHNGSHPNRRWQLE